MLTMVSQILTGASQMLTRVSRVLIGISRILTGVSQVVMPFVDTVKSIWVVPVDIEGQLNQLMDNIAAVDGTL